MIQIDGGKRMKKRMLLLVLIVTLVMMAMGCSNKQNKVNADNEVETEEYTPVEIEVVKLTEISNETNLNGKIHPQKEIMVLPKLPGKVNQVNVTVGSEVKQGDILFILDDKDIRQQVEQTRLSVEMAKINYERTKEQIDAAKLNYEKAKELYEQGLMNKSQYEQAQMAASEKPLEISKIQLQQAELGYQQALSNTNNTIVTAPINGIVSIVNVKAGEMASNAQPAVIIVDTKELKIKIDVTENTINKLLVGQSVKVEIPAISVGGLTGKIESISPVADARTRLYPVQISLEENTHPIKPGMFASVVIATELINESIAVRTEAVLDKDNRTFVYVVENDMAVEKEVKIGMETKSTIQIIEGLNVDEMVIVKGQQFVGDGSKVKVVRGEK